MKEKVKIKFIFIATLGKEMVKIDYYTVSPSLKHKVTIL